MPFEEQSPAPELLRIQEAMKPMGDAQPIELPDADKGAFFAMNNLSTSFRQNQGTISQQLAIPTFTYFHAIKGAIREEVRYLVQAGEEPMVAIHNSIIKGVRQAMSAAITVNPHFQLTYDTAMEMYGEILQKEHNSDILILFQSTINHGVGFMAAIYEIIPTLFERVHGRLPTTDELKSLIPSAADTLFGVLTNMDSVSAVVMEDHMGLESGEDTSVGYPFSRSSVSADCFDLRTIGGKTSLDITEKVLSDIRWSEAPFFREYYGCIAARTRIPGTGEKKDPMVFSYMKNLIVSLLEEHWYPTVTDKK